MTEPRRRFPRRDELLIQILLQEFPDDLGDTGTDADPIYHVGNPEELPIPLPLPYVWVRPVRGQRDAVTDQGFVDIEVFDSIEHGDSYDLAERIADGVKPRMGVAGYGVLDTVRIAITPQSVRWGDSNVSRHLVQFQVSARRTGG